MKLDLYLAQTTELQKIASRLLEGLPTIEKWVFRVLLSVIAYFVVGKLIKKVCNFLKTALQTAGVEVGATQFISSFAKAAMYVVLLMIIGVQLGIKESSLVAVLASAGAALVLALQGGLSNLAGGVIILVLQPFTVGDYIIESTNKQEGTVVKIDLFYTTLTSVDNKRIIVPNGTLTGASIVNVTAQDRRNLEIKIMISYQADLIKAKSILDRLLREDPTTMSDKEIKVFVDELADDGVIIGFRVWVKTEDYWPTKWRLNEAIKLAFDEEKIEIPYPQLDVHIK